MSHKRGLSHDEAPLPKRQDQKPSGLAQPASPPSATAASTDQYVYIATENAYGKSTESTEQLFEVFATSQDADRRLRTRQLESDHENWDDCYDEDGCLHSHAEKYGGDGVTMHVRKMLVQPAGSVPPPPPPASESSGDASEIVEGFEIHGNTARRFRGFDDDEDESGSDLEDPEVQTKRFEDGRSFDCRGCGCGDPRCPSCDLTGFD